MERKPLAITAAFFNDSEFQDQLVFLLATDPVALAECGNLLQTEDFQPLPNLANGRARWIVAGRALEYWGKYRKPVGRLLRSDVLGHMESLQLGERQRKEVQQYLAHLGSLKAAHPQAVVDQIVSYKVQRLRARLIEEMAQLHSTGQLTDESWAEFMQQGRRLDYNTMSADYFSGEELDNRIARRRLQSRASATPSFLIDPLDEIVEGIRPGHLGLIIAPTKRGKSLFLIWLAIALAVQRMNVLFFTLEDPRTDVEDRMDAALSGIPIHQLGDSPDRFWKRWRRNRRNIRAQIRIVDGTERGYSVHGIEGEVLRYRNEGFITNAVIVDYDDEILPARKLPARDKEFDQIYRDQRRLAATYQLIFWTAAQTQRGTENMRILTGDRVADAIGKIRKSTMTISLGKGDWGPDSMYLWVAAHKFDRKDIGCNIVGDKTRMLIYDREATAKRLRQEAAAPYSEKDEYE